MNRARLTALGLSLVALTGCGSSNDFGDLQQYMNEVRAKPKGTIEPLPAFIPYEAFTYSAAALRHPFQPPVKLDLTQRQKGSKDIQPDESRVNQFRSEEHTSELQSLMRISYAVFCLQQKMQEKSL